MTPSKNIAVFIMGATASGKTNLALNLSALLPIEIISVDSTAIYKMLNIGSAKPSIEELSCCTHHLIDIKTPLESYSVAEFLNDSIHLVKDINSRGKIPVFVGGTMMYYQSLLQGIHHLPSDLSVRQELLAECDQLGLSCLYEQLTKIDPIAAGQISANDKQRVLRKLEVCRILGYPITQALQEEKRVKLDDCNILQFQITPESRDVLYKKSEDRFDQMVADGILNEVKHIVEMYPEINLSYNSLRSVGYKQVWQYLCNDISYQDMVTQAKTATRNLVKRQYTWLRQLEGTAITNSDVSTIVTKIKSCQDGISYS